MALTRGEQMSRIRGKNTFPEMRLRRALFSLGLRFRVHYRTPAGRADVAFPAARLAVEVDGCFWHGCPQHYVKPRSGAAFWAAKLRTNVRRDALQVRLLENAGWRICRFWEHEVATDALSVAREVEALVRGDKRPSVPLLRVRAAASIPGSPDWVRLELIDLRDPRYRHRRRRRRVPPGA
jgi:DNA mismatch endonuclease (patch repair protein)